MLGAGIVAAIALGLASRRYKGLFPALFANYPGDALWAIVLFQCIAFVKPAIRLKNLAVATLLISFLVEFSQLYQAPWLNAIRITRPGHLLLGEGFDGLDLLAYTAGVGFCILLDFLSIYIFQRKTSKTGSGFSPVRR